MKVSRNTNCIKEQTRPQAAESVLFYKSSFLGKNLHQFIKAKVGE